VIAFRGLVDLMARRMLPWPSLYGTDDADLKEEDVVNRRRASFWRFWLKVVASSVRASSRRPTGTRSSCSAGHPRPVRDSSFWVIAPRRPRKDLVTEDSSGKRKAAT
jgi:hypothetical protein